MKFKIIKNKKRDLFFAIILIFILILPVLNSYSDECLSELQMNVLELKKEKIDPLVIEKFISEIFEATNKKDYGTADSICVQGKKYAKELFEIKNSFETLQIEYKRLKIERQKIEKLIGEGLFELESGSIEQAKLINEKANQLIEMEYRLFKINSIKRLENINSSEKKVQDLIEYGNKIENNESEKIILFNTGVEETIKAISQIKETEKTSEEYNKINKGILFLDILSDMKINLELGNYFKINEIYESSKDYFHYANVSFNLINYAESQKYKSVEANTKIEESKSLFEKERFYEVIPLIESAVKKGEEEKSKGILISNIDKKQNGFLGFIFQNFWKLLIVIIFIGTVFIFKYKEIYIKYKKYSKKVIGGKIQDITEKIKDLQKKYYIKQTISKKTYRTQLSDYEERIIIAKEKLEILKNR